ncbi:MAG: S41 family peptidase [Candidatus Cloacimonetes bacterium]|jgi:hypothetical protein|nr:S41 family peptidase [Candidatus Cloacimonadota bacterium]MDY0325416.1 S41 family peptidase [Candidatus Cloacimonadaceae bacterium]
MKRLAILVLCLLPAVSLISAKTVSQNRQIINLTAFTKLYGYVKHFHPSDEAQSIDWDKFSVFGAQQVQNAANDQELATILDSLFRPIAPSLELSTSKAAFSDKSFTDNTNMSRTCWQYKGYNNHPDSYYSSFRTHRSFQTPKRAQWPGSMSVLSIPLEELKTDFEQLRFSFSITQAVAGAEISRLGIVYNDDIVYESVKTDQWERKSVTWDKSPALTPVISLYILDISQCYLDSLKVEVYADDKWSTIYANDLDADKPGLMPAGMDVNIHPAQSAHAFPNIDILVKNVRGKNLIEIKASDTDLPYTMAYITRLFAEEPAPEACTERTLSKNIHFRLPLSLPSDTWHTYPIADTLSLNALKSQLEATDIYDRNDISTYFGALIIYWNQLQHFYPYWQYADTDWDQDLQIALKETLNCHDFRDFILIFRKLASQTRDCHASVYDNTTKNKMPGFYAEQIEGKWLVTRVADESLNIPLGSEITRFNGKNINKHIDKYRPYFVSGSPQNTAKYLFLHTMRTYRDTVAVFSFKTPSNQLITRSVPFDSYKNGAWFNRVGKVKRYSEGIIYVNLGQDGITEEELAALLPELTQAQALIFDLRDYPKRFTGLISNLLSEPDTLKNYFVKRSIYPDCNFLPDKDDSVDNWNLQPEEPHLNAKTVFLCSSYSVSYCESFLSEIKYNHLATIIGQPTAGSTGNVVITNLPDSLETWWTGMFVQNPDGTRFHGVGIIPDIIVYPNRMDIAHNRDVEVDTALEYLMRELKLNKLPGLVE